MKAILFDFGNVLGLFEHQKACQRLAPYTNVTAETLYQELCIGKNATRRQVGELSPEAFYAEMQQQYQLSQDCSFEQFSALWGDIFSPGPVDVATLLSAINPSITTCIASNTEVLHWPFIATLPIVQLISADQVFRSYNIGHEKPSDQFFQFILNSLNLNPLDVLFIDDSSDNVESFRRMGGKAELFNLRIDSPEKLGTILETYDAF